MDLGLSGLASGFDWRSLVDQLAEVERAPQRALLTEQNTLQLRNNAYTSIKTELSVLQTRVNSLKDASLYDSRAATSTDSTVGTATVSAGAALGTYAFNVTQLATASRYNGATNVGQAISATSDVSGVVLSDAGFSTAVSAGTITVSGKQVTIATTDTLQDVFDNIATATGGEVTASYDPTEDKITLTSSGGEIILGSATDSSNFLQVTRLNNNGTTSVTSSGALGGVRQSVSLAGANLSTAVSDGGSGAGEFKINGVSIAFDAGSDSIVNILDRINTSTAGVTASYDSVNDRFVLTSKATGDMGIALEDVTGNFLAATGLTSGALTRGQNLLYTVDNGPELSSQSNTITESSSGISGLSLSALKEGATTVTTATDKTKIKKAVTDFIDAYNRAQGLIDTQTASSTDSKGKVTAGTLASDNDASDIATRLRSSVYSTVSGLTGVLDHLADIGIVTNGDDNKIALEDESLLDKAINENLDSVKQLFSDATNGIAVKLADYLERTIGEDGSLLARQDSLTKQASDIDTQIIDLEKIVESNRQRMIDSFVSMEEAQQRINTQLQFLQQRFG